MRSRSRNESLNTISAIESMKYSVPMLLLALALASGCSLLPSKTRKASPSTIVEPPAAEMEAEFHDRWVDRRAHELMVAGTAKTDAEAKAMASAEFIKQFPYIRLPAPKNAR
jgi:hypothetical protein